MRVPTFLIGSLLGALVGAVEIIPMGPFELAIVVGMALVVIGIPVAVLVLVFSQSRRKDDR
jgi:hypothetical protein